MTVGLALTILKWLGLTAFFGSMFVGCIAGYLDFRKSISSRRD